MTSLGYVDLKEFGRIDTGYTNKYLEERNNLKTSKGFSDSRMIAETRPPEDFIYSTMKDLQKTPLSLAYFSRANVDYLQKKMREIVYQATGHIIGRQSDEELLIIMRSIYLSDAQNMPGQLNTQIANLNYAVLRYATVNEIIPRVKGYTTYLNDNLQTNIKLPRPRHMSMKGARINRGTADLI